MSSDNVFNDLKNEYFGVLLQRNPDWATTIGIHDPYDNLLPRGDTAKILEDFEIIEEYSNRMKKMINYNELNDVNKIDWEIFEAAVEMSRFTTFEQRQHELNPDAFNFIGGTIFLMITNDYAPLEKRVAAIISRIEKLPKYMEEFRTRFDNTKPIKLWVNLAIDSGKLLPELFLFIERSSEGKITEALYQKLKRSTVESAVAFQDHLAWLQSLKGKTTDSFALGKTKFERLVRLRLLGMSSDQILLLGYTYLSDLKAERDKIVREIAPEKSVGEAMKIIEAKSPKTFEEALDFTRRAMADAKRFIIENDLATVYEEDKLIVEETPAFMAQLLPFAALNMPSRFDKPMIGQYIVTRPKDVTNLSKHLNFLSIRNTAVHEAFPGHFLQGLASNRSSFFHLLAFGTETTEGWAHYCEQMMLEQGFLNGLYARLIQLNDAVWRAVRIIVDVKLSRGEMNFEEAVNMLITEAALSREAATAEVSRYTLTPGYPMSYLLGKHLISEHRTAIKKKLGSKFNDKFFNDTIAANGFLPMSMVKKIFEFKLLII